MWKLASSLVLSVPSWLTLWLAWGCVVMNAVQAEPPFPLAATVEQWGDPDKAVRDAAEQRLLEWGEPALRYLEDQTESLPLGVRAQIPRLRPQLEAQIVRHRTEERNFSVPMSPRIQDVLEAFAALETPVFNQLSKEQCQQLLSGLADPPDAWTSLEAVARQTQSHLEWSGTGQLRLSPGLGLLPLAAQSHNCTRIRILQIQSRQDFTTSPPGRILRLLFQLDVDPLVRPLSLSWKDADWSTKWGEHLLEPLSPLATRELSFEQSGQVHWTIDYRAPRTAPNSSRWELQGSGLLRAALRPRSVKFSADPQQRKPFVRTGGLTVELVHWEQSQSGGKHAVELALSFPEAGPELESYRIGELHQDAWLVRDGVRWTPSGFDLRLTSPLQHNVRYTFILPEPGVDELVYVAPTLIRSVPLNFEKMTWDAVP